MTLFIFCLMTGSINKCVFWKPGENHSGPLSRRGKCKRCQESRQAKGRPPNKHTRKKCKYWEHGNNTCKGKLSSRGVCKRCRGRREQEGGARGGASGRGSVKKRFGIRQTQDKLYGCSMAGHLLWYLEALLDPGGHSPLSSTIRVGQPGCGSASASRGWQVGNVWGDLLLADLLSKMRGHNESLPIWFVLGFLSGMADARSHRRILEPGRH